MRKQKGITLISLIITIIIMMILVGVTVTVAINGGVFNKAKQAGIETEMARIEERAEMVKYNILADKESGSSAINGIKAEYIDMLKSEFVGANVSVEGNKVIIDDKYDIKILNSKLDIEVSEHSDDVNLISLAYTTNNVEINEKICYIDISFTINKNTDEEYNKNDLSLYVMQDGIRTDIGVNLTTGDTLEYRMNKNGEYLFILENENQEEVDFEFLNIKNIEPYALTKEEAEKIWETDGNGTVTKYLGNDTKIVIPTYIGTEYITTIGGSIFRGNTTATEIIIPNSITNIKSYAFYKCEKIEKIVIPNSVTTIDSSAFGYCKAAKQLVLPGSITEELGYSVFSNCTSLTEVIIPNSISKISLSTFEGCTSLKNVIISNSVTNIHNYAFDECTALEKIVIPDSVERLGHQAFRGCTALKDIVIPDSVGDFGVNCFENCTSLEEIALPNLAFEISAEMFKGCTALKKVTIPYSVIQIRTNAFLNCTSLEEITIPNSVKRVNDGVFSGCTALTNIYIEEGCSFAIPETTPWGAPNATVTKVLAE